ERSSSAARPARLTFDRTRKRRGRPDPLQRGGSRQSPYEQRSVLRPPVRLTDRQRDGHALLERCTDFHEMLPIDPVGPRRGSQDCGDLVGILQLGEQTELVRRPTVVCQHNWYMDLAGMGVVMIPEEGLPSVRTLDATCGD